jgi:hypothetical protein
MPVYVAPGGSQVSLMSDFTITGTGATPYVNSVSTCWGFSGPGASLVSPTSPYITLSWTGKTLKPAGIRIILQSAGGASSNNDGDADSSANSGATAVFDITTTFSGTTLDIWLGPSGPSFNDTGGSQQNVNPRQINSISNPIGAYAVQVGQGGYAANAAYDAAVLSGSTIIGYAEGGPATVNYDSRNENAARGYVNTGVTGVTSVATTNGPISPGRGSAPNNQSYPEWNFNNVANYGTAYNKYSSVASARFGQGGREAVNSGPGERGYPGFVWIIIQ